MPTCSTCCELRPVFSSAQLKKKSQDRRCQECVNEPCFEDKRKSICTWLIKHGAILKVSIVNKDGFRSLQCVQRVPPKESVVCIPLQCMMTMTDAKRCKMVQGLNVECPQTYLALYLLEEKYKKEHSFFHPYISLLPKHYKEFAVCYTPEQVAGLQGSICHSMVLMKQLSLREEYDKLLSKTISFEEFRWARTVVITRVFNCKIDNTDVECLVPIADMMNHAPHPSTTWGYDADGFRMTTTRPLMTGAQVFDSYGDKCNSRYFINYGFALPNNDTYNQAALFFPGESGNNFDDGFSGYTYCIQKKLETRVSRDHCTRFQVSVISERLGSVQENLIRKLFEFVRSKAPDEGTALDMIADAARSSLIELQNAHSASECMLKGERAVLQFYIDLAEADFDCLRTHPRFHAYWNLFWKQK